MILASTMYMWDPRSPLNTFLQDQHKKDSLVRHNLKYWASIAPLYADYGSYLIHHYPKTFFTYYLWPNAIKYYTPPGEFLDEYNMGRDTVSAIAKSWFNYKTNKVRTAFKDLNIGTLQFMPILSGIMNVIFLLGIISLYALKGIIRQSVWGGTLLLAISLWIINFGFSVFASPITLRYQLFSILVFSSFAFLLIDSIYKMAFSKNTCAQEPALS